MSSGRRQTHSAEPRSTRCSSQSTTRYNGSHVVVADSSAIGKPIITIFQLALPSDPQIYFGPSPVS